MGRKAFIVCVIAAAIVGLLLAAVALRQGSVSAQPVAGTTYTGTADRGTVESTVSAASAPTVAGRPRPTPTPAPSPSPTPTPTPAPSPSPTPTPAAARAVTVPARSWANFAWTGDSSPQEVADCFGEGNIAVMYRHDADTQLFERWIRGREALSNMGDVAQFDALLALNASDHVASCNMADPSPVSPRTLTIPAASWANFAWTGDSSAQEVANCYDEGKIAVMYRLDAETQVFERWIRGREELTTMGDVAQFDVVLALNASDGPATCQIPGSTEAPATPTPSPTPTAAAAEGSPTDYLDTFHGALNMSMEMDGLEMDFAIRGDFEASNRCSCDITASMWGMPLVEEHLIVIGREAWIDTGEGWYETTSSDPEVVAAAGICPACPSFWEDFAFEAPPLPGEHETKNGVAAIHYSFAEFYEAFEGMGLIPEEMEGVSIETFDIWVAEEDGWLVCLDMDVCVEAEAMEEEIGMPVDEIDSVCMQMSIDITQVNDPRIQVNAPGER